MCKDLFKLRLVNSEDKFKVLGLYKEAFKRELSVAWWDWFNEQCPTGKSRTWVYENKENGQLVCALTLLPIRLQYNQGEVQASLAVNGCTHPDYHGKGLFTKIDHYALEREWDYGVKLTLGVPNKTVYSIHMKVGYERLCPLPFLAKYNCKKREHTCQKIDRFDGRFDNFFNQVITSYDLAVIKDSYFMNWRAVDRPEKTYTKFMYEEGGQIKGYVVLKNFEEKGYKKSHIIDFQAVGENSFKELIAAAEDFAQGRDELNLWTHQNNPYQQQFLDAGFEEKQEKDVLIMGLNKKDAIPLESSKWFFSFADNDVY